jgi:hypothetical protein
MAPASCFFHNRAGIFQPERNQQPGANRVSVAWLIFKQKCHRFVIKSESVNLHLCLRPLSALFRPASCDSQRIVIKNLYPPSYCAQRAGHKNLIMSNPLYIVHIQVRLKVYWSHDKARKTSSAFIPLGVPTTPSLARCGVRAT